MRRPRCHAAGRVPFPESQHLFFFLSECLHVNEPIDLRNYPSVRVIDIQAQVHSLNHFKRLATCEITPQLDADPLPRISPARRWYR